MAAEDMSADTTGNEPFCYYLRQLKKNFRSISIGRSNDIKHIIIA